MIERLASDACDWNSAPRMETSYYSADVIWGNACGIVQGDNEYAIQNRECQARSRLLASLRVVWDLRHR
jgi:steroid 5-alpha reductase family enzyme